MFSNKRNDVFHIVPVLRKQHEAGPHLKQTRILAVGIQCLRIRADLAPEHLANSVFNSAHSISYMRLTCMLTSWDPGSKYGPFAGTDLPSPVP